MSRFMLTSSLIAVPPPQSASFSPPLPDLAPLKFAPEPSTFVVANWNTSAQFSADPPKTLAAQQPMYLLASADQMILPSPAPVLTISQQTFAYRHENHLDLQTTTNPSLGAMPIRIDPLIRLNRQNQTMKYLRFKMLQQWEGVVSEIGDEFFKAELLDLTDSSKPREIVELPLEDFPDADRPLLVPGCVFYWTMGYLTTDSGQKSRTSDIRVRRNPKWSQHEIESIKKRGEELFQRFASAKDESTQR